jgi:hypothetical protein
MFLRLSIPLPAGHRLFRYCSARDLVAKLGDAIPNQEFVRHLLWMTDARIPRAGLSPFRFTSAPRGQNVEIVALGGSAIADLLEHGHLLSKAMFEHFRHDQLVERRQLGHCAITPSPKLMRYCVFRMIIQRYHYESVFKHEEARNRNGEPTPLLVSHVKRLIERDIVRQAELMLIDVPDDLEVANVALADLKPHKVVEHRSNLSARITFTLNYALKGPWSVGHLASRGFGVITKNIPAAANL